MTAPLPALAFPTAALARSELWDEVTRNKLAKPKFKKKDIDARKAEVRLVN
jgi:ribonuclease P/MRP protein subunit POP1